MNKRGQSIIEYALIAVLVILGVVVMGPYVLRSVGAHFKLWDEGIKDSFEEKLTQAPSTDVPIINSACDCWYESSGCGSTQAGSQCKPTESILNLKCSLNSVQGCDVGAPQSKCQADPVNCCTAWTNIRCGGTPPSQPTLPANDCYYGYELQGHQCGNTATTQCVLASSIGLTCAPPSCSGIISTTSSGTVTAAPCPNEPPVTGTMSQSNNISYVAAQANCDPAQTCQVYCLSGYVLNTDKSACVTPAGTPPAPSTCFKNNCTGIQANGSSCYTPFTGQWNGYYDINQHSGTQGDEIISVVCNANGMGGICFTPPNQPEPPQTGGSCSSSTTGISCSQSAWFYTQNGNNTSNYRDDLTCLNGQLVSITSEDPSITAQHITAAPVNGCNWSGVLNVLTLQAGNDMYLTCDTSSGQGVLTQFVYAPNG